MAGLRTPFVLALAASLLVPAGAARAAPPAPGGEISPAPSPESLAWTRQHERNKRMTAAFGITLAVGSTVGLIGIPVFLNTRARCTDDQECGPYWAGVGISIAGATAAAIGLVGLIVSVVKLKRHMARDPNPPTPRAEVEIAGGGMRLRF